MSVKHIYCLSQTKKVCQSLRTYNVKPTRRQICFAQNVLAEKSGKNTYIVEPTTMKIQKFEAGNISSGGIPPVISRYSTKGFHIQGNKLYGSIAVLPRSVYSWKVKNATDINQENLQLFTVLQPKLEILVIGTGLKIEQLSKEVRDYMKRHGIALEVLDTPNACSTFNFLLEEGRLTAAALIPPSDIPLY